MMNVSPAPRSARFRRRWCSYRDADPAKSQRVFEALLVMKKLDIRELERAYAG
jgi:hypothetical protein